MKTQVGRQPFISAPTFDSYAQVITAIQTNRASSISVPDLSKLLAVKSTTLNARFRREQIAVKIVGRTNFVPLALALEMAELHKFALIGWPTLQQASQLTGVKAGTIKARCEKGRLEGYIDLTKRLRINPGELEKQHLNKAWEQDKQAGRQTQAPIVRGGRSNRKRNGQPSPASVQVGDPFHATWPNLVEPTNQCAEWIPPKARPFVLPPAPEPGIRVVTGKDYALRETEDRPQIRVGLQPRQTTRKKSGRLNYDPERPFSVTECAVGRSIRYGQYDGTIVKIIDDPFSPKIQVKFPEHEHPLMRDVLLIVERSLPRGT
jgi:hypothetical protein